MTRKQRFMEVVRIILRQQKVLAEDYLTVCDCFSSMPEHLIPDARSYRYFAHDTIDFFMGRDERCKLHHKRTARYIEKWKRTWVPDRKERFGCIPPGHPVVAWTCDTDLRVRLLRGNALGLLGLRPEDFLCRSLPEFWGTDDESHPVVGPFVRALRGVSSVGEARYGGRAFVLVVTPQTQDEAVVGVHGTAVVLPEHSVARTAPHASPDPANFEPVVIQTDQSLRVVNAVGHCLKPSAADYIGVDLYTHFEPDGAHALDVYERALRGETVSRRVTFRGKQWHVVAAKRLETPGVVTVNIPLTPCDPPTAVATGGGDRITDSDTDV